MTPEGVATAQVDRFWKPLGHRLHDLKSRPNIFLLRWHHEVLDPVYVANVGDRPLVAHILTCLEDG